MIKRLILFFTITLSILLGTIIYANLSISLYAQKKVYNNVKTIPYNKVGLLLGTSKYLSHGSINMYYAYRIKAATLLFFNHKISYLLVSGDNGNKSYNEPKKIKEDLIKAGIPENKIILDYAGFRTLDSVVRASKVFGEQNFTVISQQFHNERAIFLASKFDCDAIGFNAKDVNKTYGLKVQIREYFARVKVFIDLIFNVQPKFLGNKIAIGD